MAASGGSLARAAAYRGSSDAWIIWRTTLAVKSAASPRSAREISPAARPSGCPRSSAAARVARAGSLWATAARTTVPSDSARSTMHQSATWGRASLATLSSVPS